jgi:uncharacterized membrane protein YsdA (DUF1294 family)
MIGQKPRRSSTVDFSLLRQYKIAQFCIRDWTVRREMLLSSGCDDNQPREVFCDFPFLRSIDFMSPRFFDSTRDRVRRWLWIWAIVWSLVTVTVIVYDLCTTGDWPGWVTRIYFYATLVFSLVAFSLFGWDKRQSKREGARRISEKTLHRLSMLGGWPGAILGQQIFNHKTAKASFRLKSGLILFVHLLIILFGLRNFLTLGL